MRLMSERARRRDRRRSARETENGFTLIELMMTVVILGLVVESLLTNFITQKKTYEAQDAISDMQQNLRVAAQAIASDMYNSGAVIFGSQCDSNNNVHAGIPMPDIFLGLTGGYGSKGTDNVNYSRGVFLLTKKDDPTLPDDGLKLATASMDTRRRVVVSGTTQDPQGGNYDFKYCAVNGDYFKKGDVILAYDFRNSALFRISNVTYSSSVSPQCPVCFGSGCGGGGATGPQKYEITLSCSTSDFMNAEDYHKSRYAPSGAALNYSYEAGKAFIAPANIAIYYLQNNSLLKETLPFTTDEVIASGTTASLSKYIVAENITMFQAELGFDTSTGMVHQVDQWRPTLANDLKMTLPSSEYPTNGGPQKVRAARIHLIARTDKEVEVVTDPSTEGLSESSVINEGQANVIVKHTLATTPRTGYRYRLLSLTIDFKNTYGTSDDPEEYLKLLGCK